jgi:hypothetical protein
MQTYSEMQTELLSRLMVAGNSTLFTTTRIQTLIKDAHLWATSQYLWPQLERARTTSTTTDYYYDYPSDFRTDSIVRVIIDSVKYERKAFEDFLDYKYNYPTHTDKKIFADYGRQIFIFPTPSAGSNNFDVWGCIQATQMTVDASETIFSKSDDAGNEAIIKKALSVALAKINKNLSLQEENEARLILTGIWNKIAQRQQRDQRLDRPLFSVQDMFGAGQVSETGKFSI